MRHSTLLFIASYAWIFCQTLSTSALTKAGFQLCFTLVIMFIFYLDVLSRQ